jgi:tetratricopeptide (TPR) repeat protein
MNDARETAERLQERTKSIPGPKEERRHLHLLGELALLDGKTEEAIRELDKAASTLSPRGIRGQTVPQHVPIWYSLASAHLAAGNKTEAAEWFQRVTDSTTEHIDWPIPYVRSFYFLGGIHENQGDMDKARESYQRFLQFWKDGDMDRGRVKEALSKI